MQRNTKKKKVIKVKSKRNLDLRILLKYENDFLKLKKKYDSSLKSEKDWLIFQELSTQLLLKIDSIESNGKDLIRSKRKQIIIFIENHTSPDKN